MATITRVPREFEHLTDVEIGDLLDDENLPAAVKFDLYGELAHRQVSRRRHRCR